MVELTREQVQDELQIAKNMSDDILQYVICAFNKRLWIHNNQVDLCIRRRPGDWIMIPIIKKEDRELLPSNLIANDAAWFTVGTNLYFYKNKKTAGCADLLIFNCAKYGRIVSIRNLTF